MTPQRRKEIDAKFAPKDESKEVKEGGELFTGGEWELDDSSKVGVTLWANDKRDEGVCLATIYTEAKEWEANAALIAQSKNMYYGIDKILKECHKKLNEGISVNKPLTIYELKTLIGAIGETCEQLLKKANPNY